VKRFKTLKGGEGLTNFRIAEKIGSRTVHNLIDLTKETVSRTSLSGGEGKEEKRNASKRGRREEKEEN